jgi:hypothetical protein
MELTGSNFEAIFFSVRQMHTAEGAYAALRQIQQNVAAGIEMVESEAFAHRSNIIQIERGLTRTVRNKEDIRGKLSTEKREAAIFNLKDDLKGEEADEWELKSELKKTIVSLTGVCDRWTNLQSRMKIINMIMQALRPFVKGNSLTLDQHLESIQREEWKLSLIFKAESHMVVEGKVPMDLFERIRLHPDFSEIFPVIERVRKAHANSHLKPGDPEYFPFTISMPGQWELSLGIDLQAILDEAHSEPPVLPPALVGIMSPSPATTIG